MIDNFSILLSHALLAFAFWILVNRADLDHEEPPSPDTEPEGFMITRASQNREPTPDA